MKTPTLLQGRLKWLVARISPIITQKSSQCAKSCKDILVEELDNHLGIVDRGGNDFHLLEDIINHYKDAKIIMERREWTHELNPPYIKKFYIKNPTFRHLMPLENVPFSLASITLHNKLSCIFKECRPIETHLKYLYNGLVWSKVSYIS